MSEAGWGFNHDYDVVQHRTQQLHGKEQDVLYFDRRTPAETVTLTREQLRAGPFFGHFDNRDIYTNAWLATNYEHRAALLARAIPAESFAAGANALAAWGSARNVNQSIVGKDVANKGFVEGNDEIEEARHTFFIVAPYYYNHGLYERLVNQ